LAWPARYRRLPGEWLVLLGTLQTHTGAGIAGLAAMVFGGAYFMSLYRKAFSAWCHGWQSRRR
jgi:NADH:ubiquinone oxidoreductase subunit 4 (subunit M)